MRFGVLGAARVLERALLTPARLSSDVAVVAIAARDRRRAAAVAGHYAIERVHDTYAAVLADPGVDAVYVPLPNSLHGHWSLAALAAGKHVLVEKPLAANADEARALQAAAATSGRVLMEAFHYRYHPLIQRVREIVARGDLGPIRHVSADFCVPNWRRRDIRWRYDLAGGALMDLGCYTVDLLRYITSAEPEVTYANARLARPQVDRSLTSFLRFPGGVTGRLTVSMGGLVRPRVEARVRGERGDLVVVNPILPHLHHRLVMRTGDHIVVERLSRTPTYVYQLRAFVDAVRTGVPPQTDAANGVATMTVLDAIYARAGLRRRGDGAP
ncbi:MAG: Gfo/Idh/MocA family oxidoreductase [Chloroflexi bacterium]|nr:Gfo/Idh/MocA family oxidoreductase [Chloroflexota bacterium]